MPKEKLMTKEESKKYETIKYKNRTYQRLKEQKVIVLTRNSAIMEERLDGSLYIKYKDTI